MKSWPANDEPASFDALTTPIIKAIRYAYNLDRKNKGKRIPYNGLDIGQDCNATCLEANILLSAERLRYAEEDQGRDALETLVQLAMQIGIEQGRRITMNSPAIRCLEIELMIARLDKK